MRQVADWEYEGDKCVLRDSEGEEIDTIHLDQLVRDWIKERGPKLGYKLPDRR